MNYNIYFEPISYSISSGEQKADAHTHIPSIPLNFVGEIISHDISHLPWPYIEQCITHPPLDRTQTKVFYLPS